MQKQFKYIYNNQEVSKEEFEKLAGDSFKWFEGDSIVSVPFSSFDSFLTGDFKSRRQINDHIKQVLDLPTIDCKFTMCGQKDCKCCYPQQKNINSTRHKSKNGETHKEIIGDLEGINRPPSIDDKNLVFVKEGTGYDYLKRMIKDDVITSSNRGEKETMEYLQGVKESQSVDKAPIFTYCKVNKNALEALAFRALYGHKKYNKNGEDEDWQNFTRVPNAEEEYANAEFRHALRIGGEETEEEHLVASAWNAVARLEIFLRNKSK